MCAKPSLKQARKELSVLRTILTGGGNVFFTDINEEQVLCHLLVRNCSVYVTLCACSKSELGGGNVRKPQKYTYSQHGNKCFKEEIRSLSKVGFVSKDKASFVRKDTTGT